MAAPETQFQQAGLNVPYNYSPVETRLNPPIQLQGAGALWAQVGKTALDAAGQFSSAQQALQASPFNPVVKAENLAQESAAAAGIAHQKWLSSLPNNFGQLMQYTDAQGNVVSMAPGQIQDPTTLANLQAAMGVGPPVHEPGHEPPKYNTQVQPKDGQPTQPSGPSTTQQIQTPEQQGGFEGSEYAPAPPAAPAPAQPDQKKTGPPTTGQMSKTVSATHPASYAYTGPSQAVTTAAVREALSRNQIAASGSGVPADYQPPQSGPGGAPPGMFLNPATGNIEPLQTQAPSVFAAKPAAPAPAAPDGSQATQAAQPAQGGSPAAATKADQMAMQQWQNQNAHPVMSSQDALQWMKTQTTLAQDATYLPMGGPGGAPAFAFHMKGGGINTVPVSQMVSRGAGANIAAQNTSQVISATDQQQQGAQNQPNISPPPPANLPQMQPTGQVSGGPTGTAAQPWGPPAAPTGPLPGAQGQPPAPQAIQGPPPAPGTPAALLAAARMPITDTQGNPMSAYTNVPSKGGLPPGQLGAQTTPGGQPAQPAQQPLPQPRAEDISPADRAAIQTQADKMGDPPAGPYKGDRKVEGYAGPYTYYRNDNPNSPSYGRIYTTLPGLAGRYYTQQRWYPGTNTYESYELPDSAARQQLWDKWGATGFLTREQVDNMPPEQMPQWLQRAWQVEHLQNQPIDSGTNLTLTAMEQSHKNIAQIKDMLQTLAENGITDLGTADRIAAASENAGRTLTTNRRGFLYDAGRAVGGVMTNAAGEMTPDQAAVIRALDQKVQEEQELINTHPGMLINPGRGGGQQTPDLVLPWGVKVNLANIPNSTLLEDTAFSGQDIKEKLARFDGWGKLMDQHYNDTVEGQHSMMYRVDPRQEVNSLKAVQGTTLDDPSNLYRSHKFPSAMTNEQALALEKSSNTDQFPTITAQELPSWKINHPGAFFYDENHGLNRVKPRK